MFRKTQKVEMNIADEKAGLAFFGTASQQFFRNNVGNTFGVMSIGKKLQKLDFVYDIVRIHFLILYTNMIEYISFGDTKTPQLRFFPFFET